jgi:uncharacterized membrane protein YeaQ/YmgE (transglycosylase-associated protein family)
VLGLIISAIVVGLIIGAPGRLVLPGRQDMPIWLTILIGIVAALIGRSSPARSVLVIPGGSTGSSSSSRWPWPRLGWPWSPAGMHLGEGASRLELGFRVGGLRQDRLQASSAPPRTC